MSRSGKQVDLGSALGRLMGGLDRKTRGGWRQSRVARAWEAIAGPTVLSHTAEPYLREGELVIAVDSSAWAAELSALAGMYLERMNEEMGEEAVRSVRFTVSRKVQVKKERETAEEQTDRFYAPEDVVPVPLSATELAQVQDSAAQIADPDLREAVIRATVADLELKKGRKAASVREKPRDGL